MSTLVVRQVSKPVATATAAGHTASPIAGRLIPGSGSLRGRMPGSLFPRELIPLGLIRDGPARLAANRPAHYDAPWRHGPAQHHLLRPPRLAGAEIDAFAETHLAAGGAQPPHDAARHAQQGGTAVPHQPGLNRGMQVKAHGKSRPRETG